MTFRRVSLAMTVAMAVSGAPALAQKSVDALTDAKRDELYCIYDSISFSDDFYEIGDTYLTHIDDDDATASVKAMISEDVESCRTEYKWDQENADNLAAIAVLQTASDVMEEYMLDDGFTDQHIEFVFAAMNQLSGKELEMLLSAEWIGDAEMQAGVMTRLEGLGFPKGNSEAKVEETLTFMELNLLVFFLSDAWAKRAVS